ncbi:MAG: phosphotransferase [Pseudomonadota bacterium]
MKDLVGKILKEKVGAASEIAQIDKLHGDASYRTYYRACLEDGSSFIVMKMPEGRASASEEITNFNGTHKELPFINVARYLKARGLPVPKVLSYSEPDHIMILEDLGDDIMARRVEDASDLQRLVWYKKAIDLLCLLQKNTAGSTGSECVALQRSFDEFLLNWEFDHFIEYGVAARLGKAMDEQDVAVFKEETRAMSREITALPRGLTHRDFQSRNLIVRNDELCLIDFQDALLGPAAYDLVALLRDSYVRLSDDILNELTKYYAGLVNRKHAELRHEFDLITVQRKLKDAGRFVYIDCVKGNPGFLKYIPASLGYVKNALERLPEHRRLYDALKKYVPEWA